MADGIFVAASGMMGKLAQLDVVANNMANANTPGFKRDMVVFEEVLANASLSQEKQDLQYVNISEAIPNMKSGALRSTGNPMDVALRGDAFFQVETAQGERLTRNGQFRVASNGNLVTQTGSVVLDPSGEPINIPPQSVPTIGVDGKISVKGQLVGELGVVNVVSPDAVKKEGDGLYAVDPADIVPAENAEVLQGFIEESNANAIEVMVNLIEVQRSYEALQKTLNAYREMDSRSIRLAR